jgi:hypothetical protein
VTKKLFVPRTIIIHTIKSTLFTPDSHFHLTKGFSFLY